MWGVCIQTKDMDGFSRETVCVVLQLSRILILRPEQEFYLRGKSVGCRWVVLAARSRDMPDACLVLLVIGVSFPTHSEWR